MRNDITRSDITIAIADAETALQEAVSALRTLHRLARKAGLSRLAGEIEGYAINNIEAFIDNERQMGSIESIRAGLDEDIADAEDSEDAA